MMSRFHGEPSVIVVVVNRLWVLTSHASPSCSLTEALTSRTRVNRRHTNTLAVKHHGGVIFIVIVWIGVVFSMSSIVLSIAAFDLNRNLAVIVVVVVSVNSTID